MLCQLCPQQRSLSGVLRAQRHTEGEQNNFVQMLPFDIDLCTYSSSEDYTGTIFLRFMGKYEANISL